MNFAQSPKSAPKSDKSAISLIIDGLIARGCTITNIRDGAGEDFPYTTKEDALYNLTSCDESVMHVGMPETSENGINESFIYFVLGNDPEEVVCDYGVSLSKYLDPITDPWWN